MATLQLWQPNLRALMTGQGHSATITAMQVQAIETFLDHLSAAGSPALQQAIAEEHARQPLGQFVGMTMEEARAILIGYPTVYLPVVIK